MIDERAKEQESTIDNERVVGDGYDSNKPNASMDIKS